MKIDRQQFLQEMKVRKFIRKGIELYFEKKEQENNKAVLEEQKLRSIIRDLIKETATPDNDPAPAKSTGIIPLYVPNGEFINLSLTWSMSRVKLSGSISQKSTLPLQ